MLVACAAAGVGFLLLASLSYALDHPGSPAHSARLLLWCALPLAAAVQFATAVACSEPGARSRSALDAAGMGPARLPLLAAISTAVACLLGSAIALLVFLHLRGDLSGLPFDGAASELLAAERSLPLAGALTLLCLVPAAAAVSAALTTRARAGDAARDVRHARPDDTARPAGPHPSAGTDTSGDEGPGDTGTGSGDGEPVSVEAVDAAAAGDRTGPVATAVLPVRAATRTVPQPVEAPAAPAPGQLPWGVAAAAAGLALVMYTSGDVTGAGDGVRALPVGAVVGFLLAASGLVLTGPGLVHLAGRVLALGRPGALRLLSGRALQQDAGRMGRPVGVLGAVAAGGLFIAEVHDAGLGHGVPDAGPLPALGMWLVVSCVVASALLSVAETHGARAAVARALTRIGAPRRLMRLAALVRTGALAVVLGTPAWALGMLAALPFTH
nr:hypothetical protein [Streptomyces sp. HNM0574]